MRQVKQWSVAVLVGLVAAAAADVLLSILGYGPMMGGGLAAGAGVAAGALTGQWLERRRRARELLAKFSEPDRV
jgi:ABC-type uncharacterized transport system permease subunit